MLHYFSDCISPRVVSGNYYDSHEGFEDGYIVEKLLVHNQPEDLFTYWLGPEMSEAEFVLDLCQRDVIKTLRMVNTHNSLTKDRSAKEFKVYMSNDYRTNETLVLHDTLEDSRKQSPLPVLDFPIAPTRKRYIRFEMLSFWSEEHGGGGGLQYFAALPGQHFKF